MPSPCRLLARLCASLFCCLLCAGLAWAQAPAITAITAPRQVVTKGQNLTLSVTATGATSYQWKRSGLPISGATNASFTITGALPWRDNGWYQAVASNGSGATTSAVVFVNVRAQVSQLVGWVSNAFIGTTPTGNDYLQVALGPTFGLALKSDGTVTTWGSGFVSPYPENVVTVSAGYVHWLALKADGTVTAVGSNTNGQTSVPQGLTDVVSVAAGAFHSLALRGDGTVVAWGTSDSGATAIPAGLSGVVEICAGNNFSLARLASGAVVGWGANADGQSSPPGSLVNAISLAAGLNHSIALRSDRTVLGWGRGYGGGTVIFDRGDVLGIAAGYDCNLAVTSAGEVIGWGMPDKMVLTIPALLSGVHQVALSQGVGEPFAVALRDATGDAVPTITEQPQSKDALAGQDVVLNVKATGGTAMLSYAWRKNGNLLTGATSASLELPRVSSADAGDYDVIVANWLGNVTSTSARISVSDGPAVSLSATGHVSLAKGQILNLSSTTVLPPPVSYQWRRNGRPISGETSSNINILGTSWKSGGAYQLVVTNSVGAFVTQPVFVALSIPTELRAWGSDAAGQLTPPLKYSDFIAVAAGGQHSLGLRSSGSVVAWGGNGSGQANVPAGLENVVAIAAGAAFSAALRADGTVRTWGAINYTPASLGSVTAIAAGMNHMMALRADGSIVVWDAGAVTTDTPLGLVDVIEIAGGANHKLALRRDGTMISWGDTTNQIPSGLSDISAVAAGYWHSLALKSDGTVVTWGSGSPNIPAGLVDVVAIAASDRASYALKSDGTITGWSSYANSPGGFSEAGQIVSLAAGPEHLLALRDTSDDAAPVFTQQPANAFASVSNTAKFIVAAIGPPAPVYQWQRQAAGTSGFVNLTESWPYSGTATATLSVYINSSSMTGDQFRCVATNGVGSPAMSNAATLTLGSVPSITNHPTSRTVAVGASTTFNVSVSNTAGVTYAWRKNGTAIPGATEASLTLRNAQVDDAGNYDVVITNQFGPATSGTAILTVAVPAVGGLSNLSISPYVGSEGVSAVFRIGGVTPKSVLIRGVGPTLSIFGIAGAMADPRLELFDASGAKIAENDNWGGGSSLANIMTQVGAFPLGSTSLDAAMVVTLLPGTYSVQLQGSGGGTGVALLEIYGVGFAAGDGFPYLAVRAIANSSFTVGSVTNTTSSLVVRAAGPALSQSGALTDPRLTVFAGSTQVAANDDWGSAADAGTNAAIVAGFGGIPFAVGSKDSMVGVVLTSRDFSTRVDVASGFGGTALVEIFDALAPATPVAPYLITPPAAQTLTAGQTARFSVVAGGTGTLSYQWRRNGNALSGATTSALAFPTVGADAGSYDVVVTNGAGSLTTPAVALTVNAAVAPIITSHPAAATVNQAGNVSFSVSVSGSTPLAYQWRKNGTPLSDTIPILNSNSNLFALANLQPSDAGTYDVVVSNAAGNVTSNGALLTVVPPTPPTITSQPVGATLNLTNVGSFRVTAAGSTPLSYQWRKNGNTLPGVTGSVYVLGAVNATHAGTYDVIVTNPYGNVTSNPAVLTINPAVVITEHPASVTTFVGATASFTVGATGFSGLSYQWRKNNNPIAGATNASYTLAGLLSGDAGAYEVVVSNSGGSATSNVATLTVNDSAPQFTTQPAGGTLAVGASITLSASITGTQPFTYQWSRNGVALSGAVSPALVINNAQSFDAGDYTLLATNARGQTTSGVARVVVVPRVGAYSARLTIDGGGAVGTFTIEGALAKRVLLRVVGPGLAPFGINGMADPRIELFDGTGQLIAVNNDWGEAGDGATVSSTTAGVGAFALAVGSKDAALVCTLAPGRYQVRAWPASGTGGIGYLELFDADLATGPMSTLPFVAVRGRMAAGGGVVIGGLGSNGRGQRSYLLRAVGSTLGIAGALSNPAMLVVRENTLIGSNDDWDSTTENAAAVAGANVRLGAFPLPAGARDAALVLAGNLHAGAATVQVGSTDVNGGVVLLELHDLDASRPAAFPPAIASPPVATSVSTGASATLRVLAHGTEPLLYQWSKDNVPLAGATAATLTFSPVLLENGGAYSVTVANASGTAKSVPVALTVSGTGLDVSATQAVAGGGYAASGVVTIHNTLTYTGTPTSLAWNANLPVGWTYIFSGGTIGDVKPLEGTSGSLGWAWSTPPDGGVSFSYTLRVPAGTTGAQQISALAIVRVGDAVVQRVAAPNPLGVPQFTTHSADTDADFRISLLELTRVIQLYNTRSGTTRTGAYMAAGGVTEDGFTPDFSRTVAATDLARFHSADTHTDALGSPPDGRINLTELTRVIELYNTRSGTMRTGAYHIASGTEDGFAPGP